MEECQFRRKHFSVYLISWFKKIILFCNTTSAVQNYVPYFSYLKFFSSGLLRPCLAIHDCHIRSWQIFWGCTAYDGVELLLGRIELERDGCFNGLPL
jgi:hypothetical protein